MLLSAKDLRLLADPEAWYGKQKMKSVLRLDFSWPIFTGAGGGGGQGGQGLRFPLDPLLRA